MKEYLTTHRVKVIKDLPGAPKGTMLPVDKDGWFTINFGQSNNGNHPGGIHALAGCEVLHEFVKIVNV